MTKKNLSAHPFSEPSENYTRVPNEYFDKHLKNLTPAENKTIQHIIRKTWGWQKPFECISIPQFVRATGLTKNTVKKAIRSLLKNTPIRPQLILCYETGTGSNHRSYYWIKTEKNNNIHQTILSGNWKVEDAYELLCSPSGNREKVIHIDQETEGSNPDPSDGSNFDPSSRAAQGSRIDPHKKKESKERRKKGDDPLLKNVDKTSEAEANAVERFREQRHIRHRRAEDPPGTFTPVGQLVDQLLGSFPLPEPRQ